MRFGDETNPLGQLQPGLDGLIIEDGHRRALLLPAMWRQLSDSRQFLGQLKHRPWLPADHWSQRSRLPACLAVDIKQQPPNGLQLLIGLAAKYAAPGGPANAEQASPV